uniref:F5/8 type C domain-containing protein n=1 Tax=viral metagenome TaxID=1070528 RepID=A0A6M3L3T7_9ZZZZ
MSANTYFYCPGAIMEKAAKHAVTSSAQGYEPVNALDFNPITYWRPSSNVAQSFQIDLGEAKSFDNVVVVFQNYDTAGAGEVGLEKSNSGIGVFTAVQSWYCTAGGAIGERVKVFGDVSTAGSWRYWNVTFQSYDTAICVNQIMLCQRQAVSFGSTAPEQQENPIYLNSEHMSGGGVRFVFGKARGPIRRWSRNWAYTSSAVLTTIQQPVNWSFGKRYPFVYSDDVAVTSRTTLDASNERFLCRFNLDGVPVENPTADFWNASLDWSQEIGIDDGEAY